LQDKGLTTKYERIKSGDKIKYMYLKKKNPLQCSVISFPASLPEELGLPPFLDYDSHFDMTFTQPSKVILDAIGWSLEENNSLEQYMRN